MLQYKMNTAPSMMSRAKEHFRTHVKHKIGGGAKAIDGFAAARRALQAGF